MARISSRRLYRIALMFGLVVLADVALFGWLLLDTLSEREMDRALLETREDVEGLARQLAGEARERGEDLFVAIATERETKTYIDSVLRQRDMVRRIEIRDKSDRLVYLIETHVQEPSDTSQPLLVPGEIPPHWEQVPTETVETFDNVDLEIPIEGFGQIRLGISREQLTARASALRSDLIQQASVVGGVSLALLLAAWAAVLYFARRGEVLEEQAAERERMAYLGTLAAGLAHEIRNPLNSLNLNMQLIAEELGPRGHDSSRLLAITRDEIGRLERLVTDFLAYARPRPPELVAVAVRPLLERVAALVAAEAEAARASVVVEADDSLMVRGDRAQLTQLLLNLAHNAVAAIAAAERPGVVRLTGTRELGPREAGRTVLAVEDDGIGIPEPERERIFEVFFSTKKGGTGLGLAIAERIATAHGGTIEVTSTPAGATSGGLNSSSGTQVRVVLPSEEAYSAPVSAS